MKKILYVLVLVLCMGSVAACAKKTNVDTGTVIIEKKGKVVSVDLEDLDREYYDEEELEEYISQHVEEYTEKNGETVKLESFHVEDGRARLELEYDTYEDYWRFNGIELYVGTVVTAQAAGYDFETEFYGVGDSEGGRQAASRSEVLSNDDYKVAVIRANLDVEVPGTILYVSSENTEVSGKSKVSITGEGANEEAPLTYIVYK